MEIKESFRVNCPIQEVWEFIIDPHKIGSCLPSVQSIEVVDDTHYKAVVKQKVGFITATFQINTEVVEKEAPHRLHLANQGKTIFGAHGSMRSQDSITLTSISEQETEISVQSELKMGGQLAILGAKLIESKSKEIFAEATANMRKKLEKASPDSS
jgi:carbon monoxide dehydrogenase subunit G